MNTIKSLSIIMPAFNEKSALTDALDEAVKVFDCSGITFEIVIINDGSTDGSSDLLPQLASADRRIRVVNHEQNFGKGRALRTGFESSSGYDWILIIDADLQIPLTVFSTFEAATHKADVIIGKRANKRYTLARRLVSLLNRYLVQALFGLHVEDVNCPFKLIKTERLRDIRLSADGFGIDAELLWKLAKGGGKLIELPVESHPRETGVSKVTPFVLVKCLLELLRLRIRA